MFKQHGENTMIISNYIVEWKSAGYTYAIPVVYEKRKFCYFLTFYVSAWKGDPVSSARAGRMKPKETIEIFTKTVKDYEDFKHEWKRFENEKRIEVKS